jgi:hypothetical protein
MMSGSLGIVAVAVDSDAATCNHAIHEFFESHILVSWWRR